jgi:hypothetical protein
MTRFRRLVLELGNGGVDSETMRQAAAFAHLMDAALHALFVEDEILLHASALPFAREISPLSYRWCRLEPDRLEAELRAAADRARQQFMEVARATGIRRSFEVRRGDLALHVTDTCVATDIVVICFPRQIGTAHGVQRLSETAQRSAASVLFLPPQSGRRQGAIVAVAAGADDPALELARRIAVEEREALLVLAPIGSGIGREDAVRLLPGRSVQGVVAALGDTKERLIVLTRDGMGEAADLAATRGVPVLVLEPV